MLRGAELIREAAAKKGIIVNTTIQNVWESPEVNLKGIHVLVQMMPLCKDGSVYIVSGKPFINHIGEKKMVKEISEYLEKLKERGKEK